MSALHAVSLGLLLLLALQQHLLLAQRSQLEAVDLPALANDQPRQCQPAALVPWCRPLLTEYHPVTTSTVHQPRYLTCQMVCTVHYECSELHTKDRSHRHDPWDLQDC
jgi:hypothetical protein